MKLSKIIVGIALLALLPVIPQVLFGYEGHDFRQHVPSWMELRDLWQAGQFWAGWAPRANFNLGDPRFCYYPPVSFAAGAGLAMFLPFRLVPGAFVWLTFTLSGLSMYLASKDLVAEEDRWKVALLYMASPYLITTSLVRYAASEALTLVWLPFVALNLYRSVWGKRLQATLLLGCFLGLTWITNVPASIVLLYVLLGVVLIHAVQQRSVRPALAFLLAESIAGALAAFYLAPTWLEQAWFHKDAVLRDSYTHYFLFSPLANLPLKFFLLSLWCIATISTILVLAMAWTGCRTLRREDAGILWAEVALISFCYQLPLAALVWKYLPELRFVDWPYRFLAPIGVAVPLMLFAKSTSRKWRIPTYALFALMAILPLREYARRPLRMDFAALVSQWQQVGYRAWPEFVPADATRPMQPVDFAPASATNPNSSSTCSVSLKESKAEERVLVTDASAPCQVRLATFFYPYWHASDESGNALATGKDSYGLLLVTVPAGEHTIRLDFEARSPARTASLILSSASLIAIALALFFGRKSRQKVEDQRKNRQIAVEYS